MTELKLGTKKPIKKAPRLADKSPSSQTGWSPSAWRSGRRTEK